MEEKIIFKDLIPNYFKLTQYGFVKEKDKYIYEKNIQDMPFKVIVTIVSNKVYIDVIDIENDEKYAPFYVEEATGKYVGLVRKEVENILSDIAQSCYKKEVFQNEQSRKVIEYVSKKYSNKLEFLWDKFTDDAVLRNDKNNKWYAVMFKLDKRKIGIEEDGKIEIIDLSDDAEYVQKIVDNVNILPGYHLNKKYWYTIKLDDSVNIHKIFELIDRSYNRSLKK